MQHDKITKHKIDDLKILEVADRLHIKYSSSGSWRKALCFCHDDHHPSLGINPAGNKWKCFVCGKGGDVISLVMEHENLGYPDACEWLIKEFDIPVPQQENRQSLINAIKSKLMNYNNTSTSSVQAENDNVNSSPSTLHPSLLEQFRGTSNEFTRAIVQNNILTKTQMNHACETFRISTADDNVIFWQIDRDNRIHEGKVMYYQADAHRSHSRKPITISWLLKQQKQLPEDWKADRCLFGLHLLHNKNDDINDNYIIAVVESEKTAVICSELIPTLRPSPSILHPSPVIWLATGGKSNLVPQVLQPLKGRKIILFPDTDSTGSTYQDWLQIAKDSAKQLGHPITVSDLLEIHATPDQKARKIDIADYIIESKI